MLWSCFFLPTYLCFGLFSLCDFGRAQKGSSSQSLLQQKRSNDYSHHHAHDHADHAGCSHGHGDDISGTKQTNVRDRILKRRKKAKTFKALGKTWASQRDFVRSGSVCRYHAPSAREMEQVRANLSKYRAQRQKLQSQLSSSGRALQLEASGVINVDTYFHVVYASNGEGNLNDATVKDQMKVLNDGFKGNDKPSCFYTEAYPQAKATPFNFILKGITRHRNDDWFYNTDSRELQMKQTIRNANGTPIECNQLHIYSTSGDGYLGWAWFPSSVCGGSRRRSTMYDGVVIAWNTIPGATRNWQYGEGDTCTHEVGHWLGLDHTFAGGCRDGDSGGDQGLGNIKDTPPEAEPYYGNCAKPERTCSTSEYDPIDNFMDYSDDCCMFRFTPDQTEAMIDIAGVYRNLEPEFEETSPQPSAIPSQSDSPSISPSGSPSISPSDVPSVSLLPSSSPSNSPSESTKPSVSNSSMPSQSNSPSISPSDVPSVSLLPSSSPSNSPSGSAGPSYSNPPTGIDALTDSVMPSAFPSEKPSDFPSFEPTLSLVPTHDPSETPVMWQIITYDDFEAGYGNFRDGGSDCSRRNSPTNFIHQGNVAVRLRDNSSSSEIVHRTAYDISSFTQLRVSFWLRMRNMENDRTMELWIEFNTVGMYEVKELGPSRAISDVVDGGDNGNSFKNNVFYKISTVVELSSFSFPSEAKLYFHSRGRTNKDQVYLDEILFEGR